MQDRVLFLDLSWHYGIWLPEGKVKGMTRFAANIVLILSAIIFISSSPFWKIPVMVPPGSTQDLVSILSNLDNRTPAYASNIVQGRNIYQNACASCHEEANVILDHTQNKMRSLSSSAPVDIYYLITWNRPVDIPLDLSYSGKPISLKKPHPIFAAKLSESERWAAAKYVYSLSNDFSKEVSLSEKTKYWEDLSDLSLKYRINCSVCHGDSGYGNGPLASDFIPHPRNLRDIPWLALQSYDHIYSVIHDGGSAGKILSPGDSSLSGMPGFGDYLDEKTIREITVYLFNWGIFIE